MKKSYLFLVALLAAVACEPLPTTACEPEEDCVLLDRAGRFDVDAAAAIVLYGLVGGAVADKETLGGELGDACVASGTPAVTPVGVLGDFDGCGLVVCEAETAPWVCCDFSLAQCCEWMLIATH